MTDKIKAQLEQIRRGGEVNMLDSYGVQVIANRENMFETVIWIEENRKNYERFIMTGSADDE